MLLALPMIHRKQSRERKTQFEMRALQNCKIIRAKVIPLHPLRGCTWRGYLEIFGYRVPLGLGNFCLADKSNANFSPFSTCRPSTKQRPDRLDWIGFEIRLDCGSDQTVISTFSAEEFL